MKSLNRTPIKETLQLEKKIKRWIANARSGYFALSKQVTLYIGKLFEENEFEVAFEMTKAMLAITDIQRFETDQMRISYDIEGYFYGEILKELLPYLKKGKEGNAKRETFCEGKEGNAKRVTEIHGRYTKHRGSKIGMDCETKGRKETRSESQILHQSIFFFPNTFLLFLRK